MSKEKLIESLKEFGRVVFLAIIPVLITSIEKGNVDWKSIAVVGVIAALRFIDKLLHLNAEEGVAGGLTGF